MQDILVLGAGCLRLAIQVITAGGVGSVLDLVLSNPDDYEVGG